MCGSENSEDTKFCTTCGSLLKSKPINQSQKVDSVENGTKEGSKSNNESQTVASVENRTIKGDLKTNNESQKVTSADTDIIKEDLKQDDKPKKTTENSYKNVKNENKNATNKTKSVDKSKNKSINNNSPKEKHELVKTMFCHKCGAKNDVESRFCYNCGTSINNRNNQQNFNSKINTSNSNVKSYNKPKANNKSPIISLILAFIWPGLGLIYNGLIKRGIVVMVICILFVYISLVVFWLLWLVQLIDSYVSLKAMQKGKQPKILGFI